MPASGPDAARRLPSSSLVTAIWGVTFVQVKDAVAIYPLFAFLAVRFVIATAHARRPGRPAAPRARPARLRSRARCSAACSRPATRCRRPGSSGRPSPAPASSPGMYVVLTPLLGARALPDSRRRASRGLGVGLATAGLAMLSGVHAGLDARRPARARRRGGLRAPDRADGAVRAALRPARASRSSRWLAAACRAHRRSRWRSASCRCRTAGRCGARCS